MSAPHVFAEPFEVPVGDSAYKLFIYSLAHDDVGSPVVYTEFWNGTAKVPHRALPLADESELDAFVARVLKAEPGCDVLALKHLLVGLPQRLREKMREGVAEIGPGREEPWPPRAALPEPEPVPVMPDDMISQPLRPWLADVAGRACVPLEVPVMPAIAGLSIVVGRRLGIRPETFDDWLVVPNLWGLIAAPPGWLKSYAFSEGMAPLNRLSSAAWDDYKATLKDAEALLARLEAEVSALKAQMQAVAKGKLADKASGDSRSLESLQEELAQKLAELEQSKPRPKRYLTSDATVAKLGELIEANPRGLAVLRDEITGFLRSLDREDSAGDREFYLEAWNGCGAPYPVDRIGRGSILLPPLCLSVFGGIQPGKLRTYVADAISNGVGADGLLQRFQLAVYPDHLGQWTRPESWPNKAAKARAFAIFEALDQMRVPAADDGDDVFALRFDRDGQRLFDAWREKLENPRLRSGKLDAFPAFASHLSKYRSLMPSLALLFHLVDLAEASVARHEPLIIRPGEQVSGHAVQLAARWCDFLELHARKIFAPELEAELTAARALAAKLEAGKVPDGTSPRDIARHEWSGLKGPQVDMAISALEAAAWVRLETRGSTGGRPGEALRIHPDLREARRG